MENVSHCNFCEHKQFDFTTGNLCGLTGKKADFIKKCSKISFGSNLKEEIAHINFEYKQLRAYKIRLIGYLILYPTLGFIVIFTAIYYMKALHETDLLIVSSVGILGIGGGLSLLNNVFESYVRYNDANSTAKSQKDRLDNILKIYDYGYDINFQDDNYLTAVTLRREKEKVR